MKQCTPVICADLLYQNIQHVSTRYPHLIGLKLADNLKNLNKRIEIGSNINEVIRAVLSFLFFFYKKISDAPKSTKKHQEHQNTPKAQKHNRAKAQKRYK